MLDSGPGGAPTITDNEYLILAAIESRPQDAYGYKLQTVSKGNAFTILSKLLAAGAVQRLTKEGKKILHGLTPYGKRILAANRAMVEIWKREAA